MGAEQEIAIRKEEMYMSRSGKFISLAEYNPELLLEWHPTQNGTLIPEIKDTDARFVID
jgi:hypothetical protein